MEGYIGEVREFAGDFALRCRASCNGQILNIQQYTALFSILGTRFVGDGMHTFQLPDRRPVNEHGVKVHGWDIGQPTKSICVDGIYPDRP